MPNIVMKYLFIDRDGTLVYEPEDYQVDALHKVKFLPQVIPALLKLQAHGYTLVMVSNQDGLGTDSFPLDTFTVAHEFILNTLESQGIDFEQVLICPHKNEDNCSCRKPKLGLVANYLADNSWNREQSFFIGDRDTDLTMAKAMGIEGIRVGTPTTDPNIISSDSPFKHVLPLSWMEICDYILSKEQKTKAHRTATVERNTKETQIKVSVDLDDHGASNIHTGIGFFDHMLDQIATHASFKMDVQVTGDLHIDGHHTIEDTGIALGTALKQALGDKRGIGRFGFVLPMDEVISKVLGCENSQICALQDTGKAQGEKDELGEQGIEVALDISGRPHVEFDFHADFTREDINGFETQMVGHFFESLAVALGLTLHMSVSKGNAHHQVEALFKGFGRALRPALKVVDDKLPSSKGTL